MICVKLLGTVRTDSGVKELHLEAARVRDIYEPLYAEILRRDSETKLSVKDLRSCLASVDNRTVKPSHALHDGDTVYLFLPVAGG